MKKVFAGVASFVMGTGFAAQPFPAVKPLLGEVQMRMNPTFTSSCSRRMYEKNDEGETTTFLAKSIATVSEEVGGEVLTMVSNSRDILVQLKLGLTPDRSGFSNLSAIAIRRSESEPWTDISTFTGAEKEQAERYTSVFTHVMKNSTAVSVLGRPLKQDSVVVSDVCKLIPGGIQQSSFDGFTVAGIAKVNDRDSVVLAGSQSATCNVGYKEVSMAMQGWYAVDIESGLLTSQLFHSKVGIRAGGSLKGWISEDESDCKITGSSTKENAQSSDSVKQRLTE